MTRHELARLLLTLHVLYPSPKTWAELEAMWERTPARERRRLERQAEKLLSIYAGAAGAPNEGEGKR